jgi:hypothetical protein
MIMLPFFSIASNVTPDAINPESIEVKVSGVTVNEVFMVS